MVKNLKFRCPTPKTIRSSKCTSPHAWEQPNDGGSKKWVSLASTAHTLFSLQQAINYAAFKDDFLALKLLFITPTLIFFRLVTAPTFASWGHAKHLAFSIMAHSPPVSSPHLFFKQCFGYRRELFIYRRDIKSKWKRTRMVKGKSSKHSKWLTNVVGPFHAGKNKALGAATISRW